MIVNQTFLALTTEIEQRFPVADWRCGGVAIWPLARTDFYLDLYRAHFGDGADRPRAKVARVLGALTRPAATLWRQRGDLGRHPLRPHRADVIFLGDGVTLDQIDGAWEDRFGEPLLAALEADGQTGFHMQAGDMRRTPWRRPTFAANRVETAGLLRAHRFRAAADLPGHAELMRLLQQRGIHAPSLAPARIEKRSAVLRATADRFGRILDRVQPRLAFTVTCYAGLGPAFLLACRSRGILSVDLQHCPLPGHKAYRWGALPARGYEVLPAVFWNWNPDEAAQVRQWAAGPWHRALHGGHPRRSAFFDDEDPRTRRWDALFRQVSGPQAYERDILVALQTIAGQKSVWESLARQIGAAPATWRWWIRRHPAARPEEDALYAPLLRLRGANIRIEEASSLLLPALLRHMGAILSVASGTAAEAAEFGVPAISLSGDLDGLIAEIARLPARSARPAAPFQPDIDFSLSLLDGMAEEYCRL